MRRLASRLGVPRVGAALAPAGTASPILHAGAVRLRVSGLPGSGVLKSPHLVPASAGHQPRRFIVGWLRRVVGSDDPEPTEQAVVSSPAPVQGEAPHTPAILEPSLEQTVAEDPGDKDLCGEHVQPSSQPRPLSALLKAMADDGKAELEPANDDDDRDSSGDGDGADDGPETIDALDAELVPAPVPAQAPAQAQAPAPAEMTFETGRMG